MRYRPRSWKKTAATGTKSTASCFADTPERPRLAAVLAEARPEALLIEELPGCYSYSEWAKGRFSEAVTVTGPGKMIFLAGVGAENENGKAGDILHKGDFVAQCKYAYNKIKRALEKNGATLADVVRITTYLTDIRNQADYGQCRREVFGTSATPAGTLVSINQLALSGMMLEVDVIAVMPAEK